MNYYGNEFKIDWAEDFVTRNIDRGGGKVEA